MGTTAHIVVVGPNAETQLQIAVDRVVELEQAWSRFCPSSDVSRMNRGGGEAVAVSVDTINLIAHGVAAWRLTNGTFNPTMGQQISDLGYDRNFAELADTTVAAPEGLASANGCEAIVVDRRASQVTLPVGIEFDPGGLGKGLAADVVSQEVIDARAWGVLVNLGGDVAVKGLPPEGVEWVVAVREPSVSENELTTARLRDSGLATSSSAKRRWISKVGEHHHILDPASGGSAESNAVLATVIAGNAWWAEVLATSILVNQQLDNINHDFITEASLRVMADGRIERHGSFERFET